jgi:hypothetical protein
MPARRDDLPTQQRLKPLLLWEIIKRGGRICMSQDLSDIERAVGKRFKLSPEQYAEKTSRGRPRWRMILCYVRKKLVNDDNYLCPSPRDYWEISQRGRAYMKSYLVELLENHAELANPRISHSKVKSLANSPPDDEFEFCKRFLEVSPQVN